jgi:hypothetical protein
MLFFDLFLRPPKMKVVCPHNLHISTKFGYIWWKYVKNKAWPTPDDLKPKNHVSNSSFMRRNYQKCFTYDMHITFHGYMVPNKGVTKRFYICVIIITKKMARSRLGQKCGIHGTSVRVEPWWCTCVSMMKQHVGDSKMNFSKNIKLYSMVLQFKFSHDSVLLTKVWPKNHGCIWAFCLKQNRDLGIIWCPST